MRVLGLDVGGANLKAADTHGKTRVLSFPLWKTPELLPDRLAELCRHIDYSAIALTMTGELCDCFETKADGVRAIVTAALVVAGPAPVHIFATDGTFWSKARATGDPWGVAASNWLALATWIGRDWSIGHTLLLDIGSTTTDIVPIIHGKPVPDGRTDPDRLASGELVYQGVRRTPLSSLLSAVRIRGRSYRTMAEFFATSGDAYLMLERLFEDADRTDTADGRPFTKDWARDRMARFIGSDRTRFTTSDAVEMAQAVQLEQIDRIGAAVVQVVVRQLGGSVDRVLLSGEGEFLGRQVAAIASCLRGASIVSLADRLGPQISRAACAYAVARLLAENPLGNPSSSTPEQ